MIACLPGCQAVFSCPVEKGMKFSEIVRRLERNGFRVVKDKGSIG